MRTIKLCATAWHRPTTLIEAIQRAELDLARNGRVDRTIRIARPTPVSR